MVKLLAAGFGLSAEGSHVGVIKFSSGASTAINLTQHYDIASFNKVRLFLLSPIRNFDSFACPIFLNGGKYFGQNSLFLPRFLVLNNTFSLEYHS